MSYETPGEIYSAIADAIRDVEDSSNSIPFREFPDRITSYNPKIPLLGYTGKNWLCAVAPYIRAGTATDISYMFRGMYVGPGTLSLTKLEPTYVTTMSHMFDEVYMDTVDLSNIHTSSVTDMSYMFKNVTIKTLDVGGMNTSSVTNMSNMFRLANITNEVNFSSWNTSSVTDMSNMFISASFGTLDLSGWDVSSVTYMRGTFDSPAIHILDLSGWNTSNVTRMDNMFLEFRGIAWIPSTFVATNVKGSLSYLPFYKDYPYDLGECDIYTDATDARTQGWGAVDSKFHMHYNSTYQDFLNAISQ